MKKIFTVLLIAAVTLGLLAGCGGSKNSGPSCTDILSKVRDSQESGFDTMYTYSDEEYKDNFDFMYGITWDMIDDGGILYTEQGGLADEISIVHLKDQSDISIAKEKFGNRIEDRKNTFQGYKPEEVYKLDNAKVIVQGNYVCLIIAEDSDLMETTIRDAVTNS